CPVTEELKAILSNNKYKHIILIDDANDFKGFNSYPSIEELRILVARLDNSYQLKIENNIICLIPSQSKNP
ncbi:MAG: hypothetical protein N3A01_00230, partial [Bacteroidales bacterium]|nr:hypothetical protein [Bacteroidales bacterium]